MQPNHYILRRNDLQTVKQRKRAGTVMRKRRLVMRIGKKLECVIVALLHR